MTMLSQITAAGGAGNATYIEDVFSTYIYPGDGNTRTITNNINLSTKGGLVWFKCRTDVYNHLLYDTARGVSGSFLDTNNTDPAYGSTYGLTGFGTSGFTIAGVSELNQNSSQNYASWTFRKQSKFFDVVTYTGNGIAGREISHSLGSAPGFMIVKRTDTTGDWVCYHQSLGAQYRMLLNTTGAAVSSSYESYWGNGATYVAPTSSVFTVGDATAVNASGGTFVAYLFASDAGGFGLAGTDNVISCGYFQGYTTDINLGYEPQYLLIKKNVAGYPWYVVDNMRGLHAAPTNSKYLQPNSASTEGSINLKVTSTGFTQAVASGSETVIYIAIRRGPMKVPTDGTTVFTPVTRTGTGATDNITSAGFPVDLAMSQNRGAGGADNLAEDRLRGATNFLRPCAASAEDVRADALTSFASMNGIAVGADSSTQAINYSGWNYANWFFRRAPGFFDIVCFTGDGTLTPLNHNLTVVPELVITKKRSAAGSWYASQYLTAPTYGLLNTTDGFSSQGSSYPVTATTFVPSSNTAGYTHVSYLFASCPGVSKVGSYTGTGTTQQINCGFTAGSRFVLIKRMDSAGDWYVWDSARGIVAGNDPYLLLNSTAAEVTSTDYVDTYAAGFELSSTAPAALNASGGTYLFIAIA